MNLSDTLTGIGIGIILGFALYGAVCFFSAVGFMLAMAADGVGR